MTKKKKIFRFFNISFIILFSFTLIPSSTAYWGWGADCRSGHGIAYIKVPYDKDADINLDGNPSESFWADLTNQGGRVRVPLASDINSPDFYVVYLNLTFIMNDEYLYILAQWNDNTTRPSGGLKDAVYFCWNMNVPNFTAAFLYGMDTTEMGGGCVDCWWWECDSNKPANGSNYLGIDDSFDEDGWNHSPFDYNDVNTGYIYQINYSYSVEIKRKLNTEHDYDISFVEKKLYEFNLGIMDDGAMGNEHSISWTYALDLRPESNQVIYGFETVQIMLLISFTIIYLIYNIKRKGSFYYESR